MRNDLTRIAYALEHLALAAIVHDAKCLICKQKRKPIKPMPASVTLSDARLTRREAEIRQARMLTGPEIQPGDTFRYRERR